LRCRFSGEPAIGPSMWQAPGAETTAHRARVSPVSGSTPSHSIVLTATAADARFQPLSSVRREGRMPDRLTRLAYGLGAAPYAAKWGARDV